MHAGYTTDILVFKIMSLVYRSFSVGRGSKAAEIVKRVQAVMGEVVESVKEIHSQEAQGVSRETTQSQVPVLAIRNARCDDSEFIGRLTAETFQEKYEHAIGKANFGRMLRATVEVQRASQFRNHRHFVALCNGERAGVVALKYNGDPSPIRLRDAYHGPLPCWSSLRLYWLEFILSSGTPQGVCYINHLCVDERFRGRGIGSTLMNQAADDAIKNHCKQITLHVSGRNRARQLYERLGYRLLIEKEYAWLNQFATGHSNENISPQWSKLKKPQELEEDEDMAIMFGAK